MYLEPTLNPVSAKANENDAASSNALRIWPPLVLIALYWTSRFVMAQIELAYFYRFLLGMLIPALLTVSFLLWWWIFSRIRLADWLLGFLITFGTGALLEPLCHKSLGWFGLGMGCLPIVLTVLILWLFLVRHASPAWQRMSTLAVVVLAWGSFTLIRQDGLNADLQGAIHWRWTPTPEESFLAKKAKETRDGVTYESFMEWSPALVSSDWTGFRGPDRDGVLHGVTISADWSAVSPKEAWRQDVGPAWSSLIVIGDRLFTQEQRGQQETVVCYDANSGKELWVHEDATRFEETVSGAGPRATPPFADGRLFTVGATGILNCLSAASGKCLWSHNIAQEAEAKTPMWGFSSLPLVIDGKVIAYAGGEGGKGLVAFRVDTGEQVWATALSHSSYSSPQLATIAGQRQCLLFGDFGLASIDPETGSIFWKYGESMPNAPATLQPHVAGENRLLMHVIEGPSSALAMITVTKDGNHWALKESWKSKAMKPEFPDLVIHQGHAYGFDGPFLCCIDLAQGKRCWKGERYGRGQVILLADQGLLVVLSESGEVILLAANPERSEVRGRFKALKGRTWNHPVIANSRLYARNDEQMVCYELNGSK